MTLRPFHLALLSLAGLAAVVGGSSAGTSESWRKPASHAAMFRPERGRAFEQPVALRSHGGVLRTTFNVAKGTFMVAGVPVRGESYRGHFIGPTFRVQPGDTIEIRLVNRLGEPTNLHEHGFHVSPLGISDNVLRTMPAGSVNSVRVRIPRNLSPGTYWYHAHMHGLVEEQIFAGLAGVIVVDGLTQRLPRGLRRVPERIIALKDIQVRDGAIVTHNIDSNAPTTRTVNGLVDPVLPVRTNQTQLLRLANIGADIWYRLRAEGTRFEVLAEDANPVGRVWAANELILPPGKRYDVLVRWPLPGVYRLRTLRYGTGPEGDTYPARSLVTVRVAGTPVGDAPWPRSMGLRPELQLADVRRVRRLTFGENEARGRYFINGRQFMADRVDEVAKLGSTEEWVIRNATREQHPFHVHVNAFQVVSINGRPYRARGLQDTVVLPVHGVVRIRMRFRDFVGGTVFHCHIAAHEDAGMMGILDITRTGRGPSRRTVSELRMLRDAMKVAHHHSRHVSSSGG